MSLLSAVPRGIVLAMQVTLVALVLLATVPMALGGIDVDVKDDAEIKYDASTCSIRVNLEADISTDLYFDITGFSYAVYFNAGGKTFIVCEEDVGTIKRNGTTTVNVNGEVPLVLLAMTMLSGASDGSDASIVANIRGSTLAGMISASISVGTSVANVIDDAVITITDYGFGSDVLDAAFKVGASEILEEIAGSAPGGKFVITIGKAPGPVVTCEVTLTDDGAGGFDIETNIISSVGGSLTDALETIADAVAGGTVDGECNGVPFTLTEDQLTFATEMLMVVYGGL